MGRTSIEWSDFSWNLATGCDKVSPGCDRCYAERMAERFRGQAAFPDGFALTLHPDRIEAPLHWRRPRRVFVNSMSDLFHKGIPPPFVDRVFSTMERTDWHRFQVLSKRSSLLRDYVNARYRDNQAPPHVWGGVSVEDSARLVRVRHLRQTRAQVRFLSLEPLLGPLAGLDLDDIHWVILGAESGPGARPMRLEWARQIRDACKARGVPLFVKQLCERGRKLPVDAWPADLRVRQWPD